MVKKLLLHTVLLAAAVGAPVAYFTGSDYWKGNGDQGTSAGATNDAKASGQAASLDASLSGVPVGEGSPISVEGTPVRDLAEVFRFDVTTDWILRHWPRVSTGLAQLQLQGYRVPLVTGTGEADLAGSLTYYFNARQKVQRITFCGTTGDAARTRRAADQPSPIHPPADQQPRPVRLRGGLTGRPPPGCLEDPVGPNRQGERAIPAIRRGFDYRAAVVIRDAFDLRGCAGTRRAAGTSVTRPPWICRRRLWPYRRRLWPCL